MATQHFFCGVSPIGVGYPKASTFSETVFGVSHLARMVSWWRTAGLMTFAVWDARTGARFLAPISTGTDDPTGSRAVAAFSPDGKTIAYPTAHRGVALWDIARKAEVSRPIVGHTGRVVSLAFSPDNRLFVTAGEDGNVLIWRTPPPNSKSAVLLPAWETKFGASPFSTTMS